ncbi:MAG TPA: helix-turn-helix transcriptional regulator [Polyangiaceae bacterium]|jgi:transcriptional regulator with XRE-family HTH domain
MDDQRRSSGVQRVALGARIRFERQRKGWTQTDLARESGFTVEEIARFESAQATPSEGDAERIAAAMGMALTELCRERAHGTRRGVG